MEKKRKIGLITIYHVPNYGSVLQAYATQCVIEKMGYECVVLNYKYPNEWHINQDARRKRSLKAKIALWLGLTSSHRKNKELLKFRKAYFHFSKEYANLDALKAEDWSSYAAFVVGSDQVWNSRFTLADSAFMLSFIPDYKYRISVASSFSSKHIPQEFKEKYKRYLEKFHNLSVREENGKCIIENDLNIKKNVKILLDPTLLLSKYDWLKIFPPMHKRDEDNQYLLLYLLTYAFESRPYVFEVVRHFQKEYGYKVIAIEGYTRPENALGIEMEDKMDAGIERYIKLFAQAGMVVTTSFHGTAFAVNFGVPLISITPKEDMGDDRQGSLLNLLGLGQCIVPVDSDIKGLDPFYNVHEANEKLSAMREESSVWFREALQTASESV